MTCFASLANELVIAIWGHIERPADVKISDWYRSVSGSWEMTEHENIAR